MKYSVYLSSEEHSLVSQQNAGKQGYVPHLLEKSYNCPNI